MFGSVSKWAGSNDANTSRLALRCAMGSDLLEFTGPIVPHACRGGQGKRQLGRSTAIVLDCEDGKYPAFHGSGWIVNIDDRGS
jgi:hypothetical protein